MSNFSFGQESITIHFTEDVAVVFDVIHEYLVVNWRGEANEDSIREVYARIIDFIETSNVRKCLINTLYRNTEESVNKLELLKELLTQVLKIISDQVYVAVVQPPGNLLTIDDSFLSNYMEAQDNYYLVLNFFSDVQEAKEWLQQAD